VSSPLSFDVETDLGRLHVESLGSGPPVLCWPALFFAGLTARPQCDELAASHRVLLIHPPGHGKSDAPRRKFTLDDTATAALRVLDQAGIDRAIFLGACWGGVVGVAAALRAPERFRALILMNSPMRAFSSWERLRFRMLLRLYELLGPRDFIVRAAMEVQLAAETHRDHPERAVATADCFRAAASGGMALAARSVLLYRTPPFARLGEVRVPTLSIAGTQDPMRTVEVARGEATAIPGGRFELVDGSAHHSGYEAPERVNSLIGRFLESLPG
jgi:3-oxoadipate enol-lactonase